MTVETLIQEIQLHYQRIKQAQAEAHYYYEHYFDHLQTAYQQQLGRFRGKMQADSRWMVSSWDDPVWDAYQPESGAAIPSSVRVGHFAPHNEMDLGDLPALVPFITQGHLFVMGNDQAAALELLQTIVLRTVLSLPPGHLRLVLVDPIGSGSNLAGFLRLPETLRGHEICVKPKEIRQQLDTLGQHVKDVIQTRLLNLYSTIEEYNTKAGEVAVPYHLLVLTDFPAGFNDQMADELLHIARNGVRTGVYVIASLNSNIEMPRNFNLNDLTTLGTILSLHGVNQVTWQDPQINRYTVQPDSLPSAAQISGWLETVGQVAQQAPTHLEFSRIAIPFAQRWGYSSADGLNIPIAVSSTGEIHEFKLGRGVVHHGLIGGITQSGKTNLLHVMITQLALKYSPNELALYLVDFKEGVEFTDYLQLPHARVVALESEREFGLSILRHLQSQMEARGRAFKKSGVGRLADFRRRSRDTMPRILLILDEYQVLFNEDDHLARNAGRLLEDLARRGAAFGIHLLLASQSPSGGPTHSRRIYDQMALRIALQCRARDALAILGEGNDAASQLEKAGEAIYNDDRGLKERNVFIRIALLPIEERHQLLGEIQQLAQANAYQPPSATVTFEGRTPARLADNLALQKLLNQPQWPDNDNDLVAYAWLGTPIEIKTATAAPLERYPASNLLILGSKEVEAYGLLLSSLLSLATQRAPNAARFIVVDFARPSSPVGRLFKNLTLPHALEIAGPRQANNMLPALTTQLKERLSGNDGPDIYLFVAGLHRWRALRPPDPYGQSAAAKKLTRLADEGAEVGIHLIVWSDSLASLDRAFKRGGMNYFDQRVALRLSETDSNSLLGSRMAAKLKDNRALYRNEEWELGRTEKFKPYMVPEGEALNDILQTLHRKQP